MAGVFLPRSWQSRCRYTVEVVIIFCLSNLPDRHTASYRLLELIALCGELPADQLMRLPGGDSYKLTVVKTLKAQKLIHTFYKDSLRGYRLSAKAKNALLLNDPARFNFSLTGASETNRIKSELTRRLRLHRVAEATVTMKNAGVSIFRDEKADVFSPLWGNGNELTIPSPSFYNSREIKEIGTSFVKIQGARSVGALLTQDKIFVVYNLGGSLMKWSYKSEMRTKALMKTVLCHERLPRQYTNDAINGLLLGNSMDLAYELLVGKACKPYFILDGNYEHFYYLTNDRKGETLLRLLCSAESISRLDDLLMADLYPDNGSSVLDHDAFDERGSPVMLGYLCDLPRIKRFDTALRLHNKPGTIICFDFQAEALRRYCGRQIAFQTIDFTKFERRFFEPP